MAFAAALGLLTGCGDSHDHGAGGHDSQKHGGEGGAVTVPADYAGAVAKCEELSNQIGSLITAGKLGDVHTAAADIKKIAEKLPELAQKGLPADVLKDVNIKSKDLAGTFSEIDEAADAGKKEETIRVQERMKALIADLQKHAKGGH